MSGPMGAKFGAESVEPVPCAAFEQTMLLIDGMLESGSEASEASAVAEKARAHVAVCAVCGPLAAGWARTSAVLVEHLEDAAERAKPELVGVADRVFARIDAEGLEPEEEPAFPALRRILGQLKPWLVLGTAAAAIGLSVGPLLMDGGTDESTGALATAAPEAGMAGAGLAVDGRGVGDDAALADEAPTDCIVRKLSFDGADGMVYRTEMDGMTVIWINEHEEA